MNCPHCSRENRDGLTFCAFCGRVMVAAAPAAATVVAPGIASPAPGTFAVPGALPAPIEAPASGASTIVWMSVAAVLVGASVLGGGYLFLEKRFGPPAGAGGGAAVDLDDLEDLGPRDLFLACERRWVEARAVRIRTRVDSDRWTGTLVLASTRDGRMRLRIERDVVGEDFGTIHVGALEQGQFTLLMQMVQGGAPAGARMTSWMEIGSAEGITRHAREAVFRMGAQVSEIFEGNEERDTSCDLVFKWDDVVQVLNFRDEGEADLEGRETRVVAYDLVVRSVPGSLPMEGACRIWLDLETGDPVRRTVRTSDRLFTETFERYEAGEIAIPEDELSAPLFPE